MVTAGAASDDQDVDLLSEQTVLAYLRRRGLDIRGAAASRLSGGVSNVVLRVDGPALPDNAVVVKQALGRLRVADPWFADRSRAHTEAAALAYLGSRDAAHVPALIDDNPADHALTIAAAPASWGTWKAELMGGTVRRSRASCLGRLLRGWHQGSTGAEPGALSSLGGARVFRQLRLEPYFEVAATRLPALATDITAVAAQIEGRQECLVLGDFSPKNVLVNPHGDELWVIDLEVAHRGDPAFDVGFLASHLLLKALHLPSARGELHAALADFLTAYGDGPGTRDVGHLRRVVACLLLARVRGSSPVEYLSSAEQDRVLERAAALLLARDDVPQRPLATYWTEVLW